MQNFRITQWFKSYSRGSKLLTTPVCRVILSGGQFIMKTTSSGAGIRTWLSTHEGSPQTFQNIWKPTPTYTLFHIIIMDTSVACSLPYFVYIFSFLVPPFGACTGTTSFDLILFTS
uniref:Uncharacterized protein n=1 Tax=Cacopsylla melanoneura TaxID=428564 RepID=A0A8D8V0I8_9HEMI